MALDSHLALEQVALPAGSEHAFRVPAWGFFRVHSGVGYLLGHGRRQELNPGEVIVSGGGEVVFRASQIGDLQVHSFNLSPELLGGLLTLPEIEALRAAARIEPAALRWLPATHAAAEPFRLLSASLSADAEHGDFLVRCRMLQVMAAALAGEMHALLPPASAPQAAAVRFRELMQRMTEAELVSHAAPELAQFCGCSERHLNRLFQKFFGQSLRDRQIEVRLQRARALLLEPRSSVSRAARASGFRHLSLFNAAFKRRFGMTPSEWRERSWRVPAAMPGPVLFSAVSDRR